MRNFLVPQSTQVDRVAARPFFMVTASMSLECGLGLALDAVDLTGFGRGGHSWTLLGKNGCRHCNPPRRLARPGAGILVTLAPYVPKATIHRMALPLRECGGRTVPPAVDIPGRLRCSAAYHTSVVAGQQVPRRSPVGTPGRSWTRQMWPIAHGDLHHQRCARVRAAISDTIRARSLIWDIACSRSSPFRCRRYRRKVCLNWRVPF